MKTLFMTMIILGINTSYADGGGTLAEAFNMDSVLEKFPCPGDGVKHKVMELSSHDTLDTQNNNYLGKTSGEEFLRVEVKDGKKTTTYYSCLAELPEEREKIKLIDKIVYQNSVNCKTIDEVINGSLMVGSHYAQFLPINMTKTTASDEFCGDNYGSMTENIDVSTLEKGSPLYNFFVGFDSNGSGASGL